MINSNNAGMIALTGYGEKLSKFNAFISGTKLIPYAPNITKTLKDKKARKAEKKARKQNSKKRK